MKSHDADVSDPMADTLPGLDPQPAVTRLRDKLEQSVEDTIEAYREAGLLRPIDAATAELARQMAVTVAIGVRSRRSTGAALAARELRETLAMLPQPPEVDPNGDEWTQLASDLRRAAREAEAQVAAMAELDEHPAP